MPRLPRIARALGSAGLLPQLALLLVALASPDWAGFALVAGFGYAALIFSFLGGVWWGLALTHSQSTPWTFVFGIIPTLVALAAFLAWSAGAVDLYVVLVLVGLGLLGSPLIDRRLARRMSLPRDWVALRIRLSAGLGTLTLVLAWLALDAPV